MFFSVGLLFSAHQTSTSNALKPLEPLNTSSVCIYVSQYFFIKMITFVEEVLFIVFMVVCVQNI